jgi:hypothetical protein
MRVVPRMTSRGVEKMKDHSIGVDISKDWLGCTMEQAGALPMARKDTGR